MPDREKVIAELQEYHDREWTDERMDGLRERNIRKRVTGNAIALLKEQQEYIEYWSAKYDEYGKAYMKVRDERDALLKEQDERYKNMVLSWLREIAINNVDCNRDMTFLDVVEDIRDRASYGLKQYFIDKQEGR